MENAERLPDVQKTESGRENINGIRRLVAVSVSVFLASLAILVAGSLNTAFAEGYCNTVSAFLRAVLGAASSLVPFSLAETLVVLAPVAFLLLLARAVIKNFAFKIKGSVRRFILRAFCLVLLLLSVFIQTFGICYKRKSAAELFALDTASLTDRDIYISAALSLHLAERECDSLIYAPNGMSKMPYDFDTLRQRVKDGYDSFLATPPVLSIKPVALSEPWTYTHISGMYMPLTGESNLNVNYPDYVVAYTTCHEAAHQLGVAYESEANFFAFLACMHSEDAYLRYAGALNLFEYLLSDLDAESAVRLYSSLDGRITGELRAYSAFFDKYRTSKAAKVSDAVNDTYLKSQGIAAGTKNYSEVTRLAAAYFKKYLPQYYT